MQSIHTVKLGLKAQQQRLDIIAANVANVGTTGYKSQSALFKDALYTQMIDPADPSSDANLKQGSGILLSSSYRDFSEGTPVGTGEWLDFIIEGDGFFAVETADGSIGYTRNGSFSISNETDGRYLVTAQGYYVLDSDGNRIRLPEDAGSIGVSGNVLSSEGMTIASIQIVGFTNKDGLSLEGNGCYNATEASGDAKQSDAALRQGYVESSNVELSTELTRMLRAQSTFSLAGRALAAWDEMEAVTNNLRT